jgi:hypothetical protein
MIKKLLLVSLFFLYGVINILYLVIGLWPFNFHIKNNARIDQFNSSLMFEWFSHAIISSNVFSNNCGINKKEFVIEMIIRPARYAYHYTPRIISIGRKNSEYFMMGQSKTGIIIRCKSKKVNVECGTLNVFTVGEQAYITLVSKTDNTSVFVNGKEACSINENLLGSKPFTKDMSIAVGNSIFGEHQWIGELYKLSFYSGSKSAEEIENSYTRWKTNGIDLHTPENSVQLFPLPEKSHPNEISGSRKTQNSMFIVPEFFSPLQKTFLNPPWIDFRMSRSYLLDLFLNLTAFIILGLLAISSISVFCKNKGILIVSTTLNSFIISITIETLQVFLPTRTSQLSDLIMNTSGGLIGALIYLKIIFLKNRHLVPFSGQCNKW